MKTVLITGSAGFVGSHLVKYLLNHTDWSIIGLDSFRHRGDSIRVCKNMDRYQIYTCDVGAPFSKRMVSRLEKVDYIINVASDSHVDRSIEDPVPFVTNNVNIALSMLELSRKIKPQLFIQISTDEVYGPALEGVNHEEWSSILPSNPYSASKAAQEAIAISYWRTYQVPLVILNTMNMFGEMQDPEKFIPLCISKIFRGEKVTIHGNENYIGKRYYLHTDNFSDSILYVIQHLSKNPILFNSYKDSFGFDVDVIRPNRYNVVGEIELNNLEVAQKVAQILDKPLDYELVDFHSARPGHDRRYALSRTKIDRLGWKQPKNFEQSLKETIEWTLRNPIWMI